MERMDGMQEMPRSEVPVAAIRRASPAWSGAAADTFRLPGLSPAVRPRLSVLLASWPVCTEW